MNINYDYYRLFYYVAKYKNFSLVAKLLNSNQPNITKLMNKLEEQMGCKLLLRSNKGVKLTAEGEALFRHVSVAYNELRAAEAELSSENQMTTGEIWIGNTSSALDGVLADILPSFAKQYPKINIVITNYNTTQAIETLKQGIVDFAIVSTPIDIPSDFKQSPLRSYQEIPVYSPDAFPDQKAKISAKELVKLPLIGLNSNTKTSELYSQSFSKLGIEWNPIYSVSSCHQIAALATSGLGIGFLPDFSAQPLIQEGKLSRLVLEDLEFPRELILLEDKAQHSSIAARKLIGYILDRG